MIVALLLAFFVMIVIVGLVAAHHWVFAIIFGLLGIHAVEKKIDKAKGYDPEADMHYWYPHYYDDDEGCWKPVGYRG